MILKYYGHSAFNANTKGKNLLFDPFITPNPGTHGLVDINTLEVDYILVTHGHVDHVADVMAIAQRTNAQVITTSEVGKWFEKNGLKNVHKMDLGGTFDFDFGTVKCVYAAHSSSMPDGSYGGTPAGFVIYNDEISFYHAGDTGLTLEMQLVAMTCPALDFAILPIGDNFTMGYKDAVTAADFIQCQTIVGCHYDTFDIIKINSENAQKVFTEAGLELLLPKINDEYEWN